MRGEHCNCKKNYSRYESAPSTTLVCESDSLHLAAARNCCRSRVALRARAHSSSGQDHGDASSTERESVQRLEPARCVGFAERPCKTPRSGLSHGNFGGAGTREHFSHNCPAPDRNSAAGKAATVTNADRWRPGFEIHIGAPSVAGSAFRGASPWRALGDGRLPGDLALRTHRRRNLCSLITATKTAS